MRGFIAEFVKLPNLVFLSPEPAAPPILPAATARPLRPNPEQMALGAEMVGGTLAAIGGLTASLIWGTPAGPSFVLVVTVLFAVGLVVGAMVRGPVG